MTPAPHPVLVIDDDRDVLTMLGIALQRIGYQPMLVTTAAAARQVLTTTLVVAILIDYGVSVQDGHSLIKQVHQGAARPAVILMSGHSWEYLADQLAAVPITTFLPKPFGIVTVYATLVQCLPPDPSADLPAMAD